MTTGLLGFALASTLVILAPGPDSMLVMRNTMPVAAGPGGSPPAAPYPA